MVVMSSGREVPRATIVRAIRRSEMPIDLAMVEAELTTSSAPPTTPTRPTRISKSETPSLNFGWSVEAGLRDLDLAVFALVDLASLRLLRAVEKI